ncbi:hypothetical protein J3B02_003693, partial [Coemansia erecta]
DRRPIDPPPIIQLVVHDPHCPNPQSYTTNPAFFMQVVLMDESGTTPLRYLKGHKAAAMAGSMVSPLHTLRDMSATLGAYFVFSDLSVRMEGLFRLRFDLYEAEGEMVHRRASTMSTVFSVHSPKRFPGMMESTPLSKLFAEQGLRIRIRTEAGTKKRGRRPIGENCSQSAAILPPPSAKRARTAKGGNFRNSSIAGSNPLQMLPTMCNVSKSTISIDNSNIPLFCNDPFAAYHSNKENVPPGDSRNMMHLKSGPSLFKFEDACLGSKPATTHTVPSEPICMSRMGRPAEHRLQHSLSLSDMAAVALLDSLSNGNANRNANRNAKAQTPPMATEAEISRLLGPNSSCCLGQNYLTSYSANSASNLSVPLDAMIAGIDQHSQNQQHPQQQMPIMGTFDSSTTALS